MTARIVFETDPRVGNEVIYTAGETIAYEGLADLVDEVLEKEVMRELWTVEHLKEELRAQPGDAVKKYRVVFAQGEGCHWDVERTLNAQRGVKVEDIRGWMARNLKL